MPRVRLPAGGVARTGTRVRGVETAALSLGRAVAGSHDLPACWSQSGAAPKAAPGRQGDEQSWPTGLWGVTGWR